MTLRLCVRAGGAAALLFSAAVAVADEAAPAPAGRVTVAALAADVQSVVIRDADGTLHRYAKGAVLPHSAWRVVAVDAARVVFSAPTRLAGKPLTASLKPGDSLDLDAVDRLAADLNRPQELPAAANIGVERRPAAPKR